MKGGKAAFVEGLELAETGVEVVEAGEFRCDGREGLQKSAEHLGAGGGWRFRSGLWGPARLCWRSRCLRGQT